MKRRRCGIMSNYFDHLLLLSILKRSFTYCKPFQMLFLRSCSVVDKSSIDTECCVVPLIDTDCCVVPLIDTVLCGPSD